MSNTEMKKVTIEGINGDKKPIDNKAIKSEDELMSELEGNEIKENTIDKSIDYNSAIVEKTFGDEFSNFNKIMEEDKKTAEMLAQITKTNKTKVEDESYVNNELENIENDEENIIDDVIEDKPIDNTNDENIVDIMKDCIVDNLDMVVDESDNAKVRYYKQHNVEYKEAYLVNSALSLEVSKLKLGDIQLINSARQNMSTGKSMETQMKILYDLINKDDFGLTYKAFKNTVALSDLNTLFHASACLTNKSIYDFDLVCNKCNKKSSYTISMSNLITFNDNAMKIIEDLRLGFKDKASRVKYIKANSLVKKTIKVKIESADDMVVELMIPSIQDAMDFYNFIDVKYNETELKRLDSIFDRALYIKNIFIPDKENNKYIKIDNIDEIVKIIDNNPNSLNIISAFINKFTTDREVVLSLPLSIIDCKSCGEFISDQDEEVDINSLLFFAQTFGKNVVNISKKLMLLEEKKKNLHRI